MCQAVEHGRAADDRWHLRRDGSRFWATGMMTPLFDTTGELRGFLKILRDSTAARTAQEQQNVLQGELNHRVKNTLAVVQAVAAQTLRHAGVPAGLQSALLARLSALARSHDLLTRNDWQGASLPEILGQPLAPHAATAGEGRIALSGPPVLLPPGAVVTVNLAVHELATNAAKHGALSRPGGTVTLTWCLEGGGLRLRWEESGGPPIAGPPTRRGFGSRLIEATVQTQLGGAVERDWEPGGLVCEIVVPLARAVAAEAPPGDVAPIGGRAEISALSGREAASPVCQTAISP